MNPKELAALVQTLRVRFERNMSRHPEITWADVETRLLGRPDAMKSLQAMEDSGGEPDVIGRDSRTSQLVFCDCSSESPTGRRSLCFDAKALATRKENKPKGSALEMAEAMGVSILTEDQYRFLQSLGEFDTKTSSWISTPTEVRTLGGALFCDRRFGKVFVYHNGAESYYAARGFRGMFVV